jgi:hypothetical protein
MEQKLADDRHAELAAIRRYVTDGPTLRDLRNTSTNSYQNPSITQRFGSWKCFRPQVCQRLYPITEPESSSYVRYGRDLISVVFPGLLGLCSDATS